MTNPEILDPEVDAHIERLVQMASRQSVADLFDTRRTRTLYSSPPRGGVATVVARGSDLSKGQLAKLLRFRMANQIAEGHFDLDRIYEDQAEYEPLSTLSPDDIHLIAASHSGDILCYTRLRALPRSPGSPDGARDAGDTTMRMSDRLPFPVEERVGAGAYARVSGIDDIPVGQVTELDELMLSPWLSPLDELASRASLELCIALLNTLAPRAAEPERTPFPIKLLVGTVEEGLTLRNLDFMQIPTLVLPSALPHNPTGYYSADYFEQVAMYPFAILVSDLQPVVEQRLPKIEKALSQPGKRGLLALYKVGRDQIPDSSLEPLGGFDPLTATAFAQKGVSVSARQRTLERGHQLRQFDLFSGLTPTEAALLRSLMEQVQAEPGEVIVRKGEPGDSLYIIEQGRVSVQVQAAAPILPGQQLELAQLAEGNYFGEVSLLTGGLRTADVVAIAPTRLLRLTRGTYTRYLSQISSVTRHVTSTATNRVAGILGRKP